jgi:hypothetical protein
VKAVKKVDAYYRASKPTAVTLNTAEIESSTA